MKKSLLIKFSTFLIIIISLFLINYDWTIFQKFKNDTAILFKQAQIYLSNIPECSIEHIPYIPENVSVIIGHAYGKPSSTYNTLNPKVVNFISENKNKIINVIFTGDVYKNPSEELWKFLRSFVEGLGINIFIAPGNHDVGFANIAKRKIFKETFEINYPIILKQEKSIIIIDDTNINPWRFQKATEELAFQHKDISKNLILLGHHVVTEELSIFSNSSDQKPKKLESLQYFKSSFSNLYKKIYIISGDSGAHKYLPSTSCVHSDNLSNITNGLGDKKTDEILVLFGENIYRYKIN